ncbi:MAG: hypothetical protein J6K82_01900 [Alphaproteobacteria bacterium]|nr:hypothetical protein [Alphaproteobacteria bacterium]
MLHTGLESIMYFLRSIFVFACCVGVTYAARAVTTGDVVTFPNGVGPTGPMGTLDYCFVNAGNSQDGVKCDVNSLVKQDACEGDLENICAYNVKDESDIVTGTQTYYIQSCTSTCDAGAGYKKMPAQKTVWPDGWDCGFLVKYCVCDGTACAKVKVKSEEQTIKGGTIYIKHACGDNGCESTGEEFIECEQKYYLDKGECTKCPAKDINLYTLQEDNSYEMVEPTTKDVGATSKKECYISAGTYYYKESDGEYHTIEIPDVYYTGS